MCDCELEFGDLIEIALLSDFAWGISCDGERVKVFLPWRKAYVFVTQCEYIYSCLAVSYFSTSLL